MEILSLLPGGSRAERSERYVRMYAYIVQASKIIGERKNQRVAFFVCGRMLRE